jgi:hypothetical protein
MYLLYLDESGTKELKGGTSHFVFLGLGIPIEQWKAMDQDVLKIKSKYELQYTEIHTGWMLRKYVEQDHIADFASLDYIQRRSKAQEKMKETIRQSSKYKSARQMKEIKRNIYRTSPYIHLTIEERRKCIFEIASCVNGWAECRLFAEVVNKKEFNLKHPENDIFENSFTQVVSRFEKFLVNRGTFLKTKLFGLLIEDNNETVAQKFTEMMRKFYRNGTVWTSIYHIVETPLFVDSLLTSMVQVADVCAYATRRYFDNQEDDLFNLIFPKFDRAGEKLVGIRHYPASEDCQCLVCSEIRQF